MGCSVADCNSAEDDITFLVPSHLGVAGFGAFLALFLLQWHGQGLTQALLLQWAPWMLVFVFANGFMEELWLRGVFLKRFAPLIGINGAVWVTSIIFASMHSFVFYFDPFALTFFMVNTLALGLGCGYLMMKSDNIWGATIIHAASDFFLFVAVLASV